MCCSDSLSLSLFQIFYPETTDIYDRKNMPRCIYCIHALRYSLWSYLCMLCGLADTLIKYYQANDQILLLISFTNCKLLNNWFDFSKQILCFWVFLEFLIHWNVSMFQAGTFLWGEQSSFSVERHSLVHRENSRFK